jgi:dsDNA-specific endonuclease/ATPase MutS2
MAVTTLVLASSTETEVHLGFAVKLDSETHQLDDIYRAMFGIPGARVEFIESKRLRVNLPVVTQS